MNELTPEELDLIQGGWGSTTDAAPPKQAAAPRNEYQFSEAGSMHDQPHTQEAIAISPPPSLSPVQAVALSPLRPVEAHTDPTSPVSDSVSAQDDAGTAPPSPVEVKQVFEPSHVELKSPEAATAKVQAKVLQDVMKPDIVPIVARSPPVQDESTEALKLQAFSEPNLANDEEFSEFVSHENLAELQQQLGNNAQYEVVDIPSMAQILTDEQRIAFAALMHKILTDMTWRYARFEYVDLYQSDTTQAKSNNSMWRKLTDEDETLLDHTDVLSDNEVRESATATPELHQRQPRKVAEKRIPFGEELMSDQSTIHDVVFLKHLVVQGNVALCYAVKEFQHWADSVYSMVCDDLEITHDERAFIEKSMYIATMDDLTKCLVSDAATKIQMHDITKAATVTDVRVQLMWNLLVILMANDEQQLKTRTSNDNLHAKQIGQQYYDARSRALLRQVGVDCLKCGEWADVIEVIEGPLIKSHIYKITSDSQLAPSAASDDTKGVTMDLPESTISKLKDEDKTSAKAVAKKRRRVALMTAAAVGGGAIIGLSSGLAAPLVAAGLGTLLAGMNVAGAGAFLTGVGGTALITGSAVAYGTQYGASKMEKRTREVEVMRLIPIQDCTVGNIGSSQRSNLIISVAGWVFNKNRKATSSGRARTRSTSSSSSASRPNVHGAEQHPDEIVDCGLEDLIVPFLGMSAVMGSHYALCFDPHILCQLGDALKMFASELISFSAQQLLQQTILSTLLSGLTWPMWLVKLGYLVDNPWSLGLDRAVKAGELLADALCSNVQNGRPVTLIGYSLGARAIFYCLVELARRGQFGVVENVYLFGAPVLMPHVIYSPSAHEPDDHTVNTSRLKQTSPNATKSLDEWRSAVSVVSGNLFNCYSRVDWVLGFLLRASVGGMYDVAGLSPVILDDNQTPDIVTLYPEPSDITDPKKTIPKLSTDADATEREHLLRKCDRIARNIDVTAIVTGHLQYRTAMPKLLRRVCSMATWAENIEVLQEVVAGEWMQQIDGWWTKEEERLRRKRAAAQKK